MSDVCVAVAGEATYFGNVFTLKFSVWNRSHIKRSNQRSCELSVLPWIKLQGLIDTKCKEWTWNWPNSWQHHLKYSNVYCNFHLLRSWL